MLPKVAIGRHCCAQSVDLENYRPLVGGMPIDEIRGLAAELSGVRLCHINSTVAGLPSAADPEGACPDPAGPGQERKG